MEGGREGEREGEAGVRVNKNEGGREGGNVAVVIISPLPLFHPITLLIGVCTVESLTDEIASMIQGVRTTLPSSPPLPPLPSLAPSPL